MRKTQLSLWLLRTLESGSSNVGFGFVRSLRTKNFSKDTKVRFANSILSLASFTGFAAIGELDAEAVARLSESRSSNMSTPESIIQDSTSSIANTRRTMASCDYLKSCSRSRWNKSPCNLPSPAASGERTPANQPVAPSDNSNIRSRPIRIHLVKV